MPAEIVMPRLSDSMEEGTILNWMKSVGDEVERGDELVEIETDKANMVYEADTGGTLVEILADVGATLPIGEVIARLGEPGEEVAPSSQAAAADGSDTSGNGGAPEQADVGEPAAPVAGTAADGGGTSAEAAAPPPPVPAAASAATTRIKASPIARRIAHESGIDLQSLSGSGPGGRIVKADVEVAATAAPAPPVTSPQSQVRSPQAGAPAAPAVPAAAGPAPPTPGAQERPETAKGQAQTIELTKLQQTVARRMAESKATAPHFYLTTTVDMTTAVAARGKLKAAASEGALVPSYNDLVVKACAIALSEFPRANGAYRDGKIEVYSRVNIGVAVAGQDALVVPTVFDADLKGLRQIAAETRALAARVRDGSITPPELSGGTFTVSNLGMYGVSNFDAVINPPQAAILAVGEIAEKPVVRDGELQAGHQMEISLACDHRILYGADGAQFLARVRALLEEPLGLAL